jgi:hypothetical protein
MSFCAVVLVTVPITVAPVFGGIISGGKTVPVHVALQVAWIGSGRPPPIWSCPPESPAREYVSFGSIALAVPAKPSPSPNAGNRKAMDKYLRDIIFSPFYHCELDTDVE